METLLGGTLICMGVTATDAGVFEGMISRKGEIGAVAAAQTEVVGGSLLMRGLCCRVEENVLCD